MHIGLNAHLLASKPGYRAAGIHTYIHHLLHHLPAAAPQDWAFTALVGRENQAAYPNIHMRRARWDTESPTKRILWEQLIQPRELSDFDVYHALAFVAPLVLPVPMVVTIYDLSFMQYPERLSTARRLYLRFFTELTCKRAKKVLAISHSTAQDLTQRLHIPPEKIVVTHPGYDTAQHQPLLENVIAAFRQKKGLPARFWLFVGTLEPRKNLPVLLEAYARLPESARLPLVLAGGKGWDYEPIFAAIERHQLQDWVSLPGFVPAEELALWYNAAEVFIYPSVFEGFGLPVLEAMACGTPVITSNVSSLPEIAAESGLCLPPHNIEAWTEGLQRAATDATWREHARIIGLDAAKKFQWAANAALTIESYRQARYLEKE